MRTLPLFLLLLLCAASPDTRAQQIADDFARLRQFYLNHSTLWMEAEVYQYTSKNSTKAELLGKAFLHKKGKRQVSGFGSKQVIQEQKRTLLVDEEARTLKLAPKTSGKTQTTLSDIDSLLRFSNDSIVYLGAKDGLKGYSIYPSQGELKRFDIYIDATRFYLKRFVYYYPEDQWETYGAWKTEVRYTRVQTDRIPEKSPTISTYLRKEKGKWVPQPAYTTYTVELLRNDLNTLMYE